jgi:hypothetical protein
VTVVPNPGFELGGSSGRAPEAGDVSVDGAKGAADLSRCGDVITGHDRIQDLVVNLGCIRNGYLRYIVADTSGFTVSSCGNIVAQRSVRRRSFPATAGNCPQRVTPTSRHEAWATCWWSAHTWPPMRGSGNLGVHPLKRAERGDLQLPGNSDGEYAVIFHLGVIIATAFAQVRRTLERGSAPDS